MNQLADTKNVEKQRQTLYLIAGVAALVALAANVLDIILGFGETDIVVYGAKRAIDWFVLFEQNWLKGLYVLGILNIVYMVAMVPVYFTLFIAHRCSSELYAALAMIIAFIGMTIYIANSAAIPMVVLSEKYASAQTDTERVMFAAAGEMVLARGEDFTPGAFIGLFLGSIGALAMSFVMLRGGIFGRATAWIGIVSFTLLSIFTIWTTFVPVLYFVAFYGFGMIGGLLAMAWFVLVALRCFKLSQAENEVAAQQK